MHLPRATTTLITAGLLGAVFGLLRFPQEVSQAVREGLSMCTDTLLPTLFPFFVLSALVVKTGLSDRLGHWLSPIMGPLFHLPGTCAAALVLGFVGGYPTGARTAAALYQSGRCTREEARRLLSFCCACSPAFLLGAVGNGLFGDSRYGLTLLGVHWIAAILSGVLLNQSAPIPAKIETGPLTGPAQPFFSAFSDSVKDSFRAMLDLFAFVLCFAAVGRLIELSGIPCRLAELLPLSHENSRALLMGLLDMPRWVMFLTAGGIRERMVLSSLLLAWGGLSIHCQICSILHASGLSPVCFLKGKVLHAILSALLMAGLSGSCMAQCLLGGCFCLLFPWRRIKKWWKKDGSYSIMGTAKKGSCHE